MTHSGKCIALVRVAILWVLAGGTACAQWALDIYGNEITLGMDRGEVVQRRKDYRLRCFGEDDKKPDSCDSLIVQGKGPPYELLANVYFQEGRAKSIRKYWSRGYEGVQRGTLCAEALRCYRKCDAHE
jgi:hypothetical protein